MHRVPRPQPGQTGAGRKRAVAVPLGARPPPTVDDLRVPRILIVDDDPDILALVRFKLEAEGHVVLTASDGETGLAAIREHRPDLVLADWTMPRLTGVEMLARMRADADVAGTPFILLTARAQETDEPGIDGFIAKPFSLADLTAQVDSVLARGG